MSKYEKVIKNVNLFQGNFELTKCNECDEPKPIEFISQRGECVILLCRECYDELA